MSAKFTLKRKKFGAKSRQTLFKVFIALFAAISLMRLSYLQIIKGNVYKLESETQAIKRVIIEPFRGNMFDRNGDLIVHNEPSFALTIVKSDFKEESIDFLASILNIEPQEIKKELNKYKGISKFTPIKIYKDLDFKTVSLIEEYNDYLTGVDVVVESKRRYDMECDLAHALGYNKEISAKQLQRKRYYQPGDLIGQSGLEKAYEEQLRGRKGVRFVSVNKFGVKVASFDNGRSDIPASNGFDLYLTINQSLQKEAEKALEKWKGAAVALDPNSGEVLAIASSPDYDPRIFSGKIPTDQYRKLLTDEDAPMYHRAIMSKYAPGSTWKMLMAIAALNEGIIDEDTTIHCSGGIKLGYRYFKCHGAHGPVDVRRAIRFSCNTYFYKIALKLGLENIQKYAEMFGFGEITHIDLPGEKSGTLPTIEWAEKKFNSKNIPEGYLANFGIGQGEVGATPLQMANYTAIIANKGTLYQPHLIRQIHNNFTNKREFVAYDSVDIPIEKNIFDIVRKGMYEVVNKVGGTAPNARLPNIKVCGKTGTAQNVGKDHSWFVCFAPMDEPEIAVSVMIEHGGYGSEVAAPIAKKLLWNYFKLDTLYGKQIAEKDSSELDSQTPTSSTFIPNF